ncbi:MAG: shikimate kinase [Clostridium sp.]
MSKCEIVSLIGMPGCGKTTIGRVLALELNYRFFDMDNVIEEMANRTIAELFEEGESVFREWEEKACEELMKKKRAVISTGGGVVKIPENRKKLSENSYVVYINRPIEKIIGDVDVASRPLLKDGKDRLYKLYEERYKLYQETSDEEILNVGYIRETIDNIERILKGKIRE